MPPKAKKSKTVKCNICNKRYADQHGLNRHMEIHEEGQYSCDQCDYTCKVAQYLARHKTRMHTDSKKLQCDICKKMFQWQSRLTHHMLVHTGEKPYKCGTCGKAFNSHYSLTTHKLIHTDEKPFKCMYCEYACRDSSTLRKHHARHAGTLPKYRCSVCTRTFTSKFRVKRHVAEVHLQLDVRTHVCHVCDKAFMEKKQLTLHVKAVHEKLKTCTCDICGRTISNSANLRAHLMTHLDSRPYACARPGCTRSYKDQSSLKKHTATHYKEMQHECEICGKWFTRAERWKRHLLQHLPKVKSVECDYCGVSFYNKKYLATHIHRKHTRAGRQRYVCDLCDFETANKPSIVMHLKYGHGNRLNKECLECGKKFKTDKFFKLHMAKVHEAGSETMSTNDIAEVDVKIEPLDDVDIDIFEVDRDHILQDLLTTVDNETASNDKVENDIFDGNENVTHENNKLDTGNDYEIENSHNKAGYNIHDTNDHETGDSDETDYDTRSQETNNSNEGFDNHKSGNDIPDTGNNRETVHDTRTDIETGKDLDTNKSHKAADNQETGNDKTDNKKANNIYGSANNGTNDIEASNNKYEDGNDSVNGNENHGPSNDIYEGNNSVDGNENHEANNAIYEGNDSVDGNENHEASNDIYEGVDGNEERHIVIEASVFEAISAHSKQLRRAPEKLFEGLSEVVRGGERAASTERGSKYLVDKKIEEERRRQMLKLLAKARREKEVKLLERTRDEYNKRLRELLSGKKTENIKIKYFKNNNKNNLNNQTITIDDEDSLQNDETLRYEEESESESEETESSVDRNNEKETNDKDSSTVNGNDKNHEVGDGNENDETVGGIDDENGDDDKSDKDYEPPKEPEGKKHKIKFNSHQCYSCFKLFPTKQQLLDHCKDHFDICHDSPLVICPVCGDVMKKNFTKHLKQVHNLSIKVPYARIKDKHSNNEGSRYYLELDDPTLKEVEIIPSVKNLNKIASTKIDENNREAKNNVIAKTKIVKKGKEWIVQNETVEVNEEYILPNFDINVTINEKKLKLNESFNNDYVERLKRLSRIAKKNGKKMLYPCEKCPKICQALAALKLHTRKHDPNKKPFKDKVYKGRTIKKGYKRDYRKDFTKLSRVDDNVDKNNKKRNFRKDFTKVSPVNEVNAIKVTDINNLKPETYQNRFAKPQPIKNKHKCDPELKEFYEKNIRGGDIEFWQFLKIFNKIDREKIEDFSDLEQRHEFGIIPKNSIAENEEFDVNTNCNNNTKDLNNKIAEDTSKSKNKCNIKDKSRIECKTTSFDAVVRMNVKRNMADGYKRILRISKREYEKRNAIRNELREKIARERDGK